MAFYDIIIGDVLQVLPSLKRKFNLIIADPPFGIEYNKSSHEYGAKEYKLYRDKMTKKEYFEFSRSWINACYDALLPSGSMYIVSGWTNLSPILNAIEESKFILRNHIIWYFSWGVYTKRSFVTSHYHILFLVKGKNYKFNKQSSYEEDVWEFEGYNRGNDPDRIKGHPCQLPIVLLEKMILTSTDKDDWVADIFSGSGGATLACRLTGRNVIAIEKEPEYARLVRKKCMYEVADEELKEALEKRPRWKKKRTSKEKENK
ncbi:MAG: site-specific DNA-methyltransferase, partial [Thermoplasmata archaeon]